MALHDKTIHLGGFIGVVQVDLNPGHAKVESETCHDRSPVDLPRGSIPNWLITST